MAEENSSNVDKDSIISKSDESEKSFVGKVRSHVSGLINSSISKWFGTPEKGDTPRPRRRYEEDEEYYPMQPPSKRLKLPSGQEDIVPSNHMTEDNVEIITQKNTSMVDGNVDKLLYNFPEPEPGPSRMKSYVTPQSGKEYLSDSTSGYSSMVGLANNDKLGGKKSVFTPRHDKSLFNTSAVIAGSRPLSLERSVSPPNNSSISLRSPSFNISTIRSPDFVDKTVSTKRVMESPFYRGRTIYGGASTYGNRVSKSPSDLKKLKESIRIKPANNKDPVENATLSRTAQRILNTLEQYTTPVKDVKKIPASTRGMRHGLLSKYMSSKPYTLNEHKQSSNVQLQVPTVPDLLRMKEKLQSSTVSVKQIANASKSALNNDAYILKTSQDGRPKHSNKIRTRVSNIRQKTYIEETTSYVRLNPVALPITTLPTFDLTMPSNKEPPSKSAYCTTPQKMNTTPQTSNANRGSKETGSGSIIQKETNSIEYKFSKPLVIAENLKSITAVNNFRFSKPLPKGHDHAEQLGDSCGITKNMRDDGNLKEVSDFISDTLKKDRDVIAKFQPPKGKWECSTCLVLNTSEESQCVACSSLRTENTDRRQCSKCKRCSIILEDECASCRSQRSKSLLAKEGKGNSLKKCHNCLQQAHCQCKSKSDSPFQWKPLVDVWECPTCMIKNKNDVAKCAACETPKAKNNTKPLTFNPPSMSWECPTCMIRNADEKSKCAACETAKPSNHKSTNASEKFKSKQANNIGDCSACILNTDKSIKCVNCDPAKSLRHKTSHGTEKSGFIPPTGTWVCPSCMVRSTGEKCAACEIKKPENNKSSSSEKLTFKAPSNTWECPTCMIRNPDDKANCLACETKKPENSKSSSSSEKLTFKPPGNTWECPTCMIRNTDDNANCLACETKKPEKNKNGISSEKLTFKTPSNTWECPTCMIRNPDDKANCLACETRKPGESKSGTTQMFVASKIENTFNFGINNQQGSCPSKVSVPTETADKNVSSANSSSANVSTFVFGTPGVTKADSLTKLTASTSAGFNFGSSQVPSASNFTFDTGNKSLGSDAVGKTDQNVISFGSNKLLGVPNFQPLVANGEVTTPTNVSKKRPADTKSMAMVSTPPLNFKTPATIASSLMSANAKEDSKTLFKFGSSEKKVTKTNETANALPSASASIFGNSSSSKSANNTPFNFKSDGPPKKMTFPLVSSAPTMPAIDMPKSGGFSFDSMQKSTAPNGGFNISTCSAPATSIFSFPVKSNSNSMTAPSTLPGNIFNPTSATVKPSGGFNFSAPTAANTPQKAGFNFGAAQPPPSAKDSGYNFNACVPASSSGGFSFNLDPNAKPSFNFTGACTSTPVFTAQPAAEAPATTQRKIKRAIRRTTPR